MKNKCKLPCKWLEKKYLVAMCDNENGFIDIEPLDVGLQREGYARTSLWVTQKYSKSASDCNIETDIVVPEEKEKIMIKAFKGLQYESLHRWKLGKKKGCRIKDVHSHNRTKHIHMLCESIRPDNLVPLVDRILELHSRSWEENIE